MNDINQVMLMGRLGNDPVIRKTKNGNAVTHFSLATANFASDPDQKQTTWHKVVVWGKTAEACEKFLNKGATVLVQGAIRTNKYETSDGESRFSVEINADSVNFISPLKKNKSQEAETEQQLAS